VDLIFDVHIPSYFHSSHSARDGVRDEEQVHVTCGSSEILCSQNQTTIQTNPNPKLTLQSLNMGAAQSTRIESTVQDTACPCASNDASGPENLETKKAIHIEDDESSSDDGTYSEMLDKGSRPFLATTYGFQFFRLVALQTTWMTKRNGLRNDFKY
jgi:hypothetical protein